MPKIVKALFLKKLFLKGTAAFTVGDYIVVIDEARFNDRVLAHEMVHVEQYKRHGVPEFLYLYGRDFTRNFIKSGNIKESYRNIPFEIEAREKARQRQNQQ